MGSALGQPRLLIPVILTLGYNRWVHPHKHWTGGPWLLRA